MGGGGDGVEDPTSAVNFPSSLIAYTQNRIVKTVPFHIIWWSYFRISTVFTLVYSLYANMIILFTLFIFTNKRHGMPSTVKQCPQKRLAYILCFVL